MLQEPTIPYDKFSEVRVEDVRRYKSNDHIKINTRYCEHCEEKVGIYYIDECDAEICDDPIECPYSADWNGAACGYIICRHCHNPAKSSVLKIDDSDLADSAADMIGLSGEVNQW
jgi:hypothetical protein